MIRAWFRARFRRNSISPQPAHSNPHHSDAEVWSEEAFYGMADQLYGHDAR